MAVPRVLLRWWIRNAASLDAFEHVLIASAASGFVAGLIVGWLACYVFHHA